MANQPVVFSVPHSGTIFTFKFLEAIGFEPRYIHADELGVRNFAKTVPAGAPVIAPVRHPYHVYMTHYQRNDSLRRSGPDMVMDYLLDYYERFDKALAGRAYTALRIDIMPAKRQPLAMVICDVLGGDKDAAIRWAEAWPVMNWSPHEHGIPDADWGRLDKWLDRFGYTVEDMTEFKQQEGSEQAQKQKMRPIDMGKHLPRPEIKGSGVIITAEEKRNGINSIDSGT